MGRGTLIPLASYLGKAEPSTCYLLPDPHIQSITECYPEGPELLQTIPFSPLPRWRPWPRHLDLSIDSSLMSCSPLFHLPRQAGAVFLQLELSG